MWRRALYWWSGRLRCRYIDHDGQPYLERYLVATVLGHRIYLHRFVNSDPDGLHDHPFCHAFSLILAGHYREHRWGTVHRRRWVNRLGPNDFHRIELVDDKDVWTLFVHSARVRPWGTLYPLADDSQGASFVYQPHSAPDDPAFSDWSADRTGRELRLGCRAIPPGRNASEFAHARSS